MQIHLPTLNAVLNFISAVFLIFGFYFIKKQNKTAHVFCMIGACAVSTLFLASYLYYHYHHGATHFQGQGLIRTVYLSILGTHTVLAALVPPLVITTLVKAFRGNYEGHKRIARLTWPIWLYVSVTGVVVYWMLYRVTWT